MASQLRIKFLGTRSIHAAPSRSNKEFGGNTGCILLETDKDAFLINSGFAINPYGDSLQQLAQLQKIPVKAKIFFTDFLWENILGLPFFTPMHFKSSQISFYSPVNAADTIKWLNATALPDFSPFNGIHKLPAKLVFNNLEPEYTVGQWSIKAILTANPLTPYSGAIWTFAHESGFKMAICSQKIESPMERTIISNLLKNYDLLIQSAIAEDIRHPTSAGRWSFEEALKFSEMANVNEVIINGFHPMLTDEHLRLSESNLRDKSLKKGTTSVRFARESHVHAIPFHQQHKKTAS